MKKEKKAKRLGILDPTIDIVVRVSRDLHAKLEKSAQANGGSISGDVTARLEMSFSWDAKQSAGYLEKMVVLVNQIAASTKRSEPVRAKLLTLTAEILRYDAGVLTSLWERASGKRPEWKE